MASKIRKSDRKGKPENRQRKGAGYAGRPRRAGHEITPLAMNIDRIRLEHDLTLEELSAVTGVASVGRIVSGVAKNIRAETVDRIASGLSKHLRKRVSREDLLRPPTSRGDAESEKRRPKKRMGAGAGGRRRPPRRSLSSLAQNLDRIRFENDLTIAEVQEATGVTIVAKIVSGSATNVQKRTVQRLAEGLSEKLGQHISAEDLLGQERAESVERKLERFLKSKFGADVEAHEIEMLRNFSWPNVAPDKLSTWRSALRIIRDSSKPPKR